jgi:hypothetical protein
MDKQLTLVRGLGGLALVLGVVGAALKMVLAPPPGISVFQVRLNNITNKHLKHVDKENLLDQ